MRDIFWKIFWYNRKSFVLPWACGTFMVVILYVESVLGEYLRQITTGESEGIIGIFSDFIQYASTYLLLIFFMVLILLVYIRRRAYDYTMLNIFGIQYKHRQLFVFFEYVAIIMGSIVGGLICGTGLNRILKETMVNIFGTAASKVHVGAIPGLLTVIVSLLLFAGLFVVCDIWISSIGVEAVLAIGKKNGRMFRKQPRLLICGIAFLLLSLISLWFYWGKVTKNIPIFLTGIGLLLVFIFGTGMYFSSIQNKVRCYYRKIYWMNNWYHRFYYHVNIAFIISVFFVVMLFSFSMKLFDNLPVTTSENYPYDIVWMANRSDQPFLKELQDKYSVKLKCIPCIRVTTPEFGEHMGISESTYEQWTGESLELSDREVFVVYQRERDGRNTLGIGYNSKNPQIYIGRAKEMLWVKTPKGILIPGRYFNNRYQLEGSKEGILTGVFGKNETEHVIVFSDSYYQQIEEKAEGADLAVLMNIPEQYAKVKEEVTAYADEYSWKSWISLYIDKEDGMLVYEKQDLLNKNREMKIYNVAVTVINMLILLICGLFVLIIKFTCDYDELKQKYSFYRQAGMTARIRRKYLKREMLFFTGISLAGGIGVSICFFGAELYLKKLGIEWNIKYITGFAGIVVAIVSLFFAVTTLFAQSYFAKIDKEE